MPVGRGLYDDETADERERQRAEREDASDKSDGGDSDQSEAPDATTDEDAPEQTG